MTTDLTIARPIVHTEGNRVFATSKDVAAYFEKPHKHVMDAIKELVSIDPSLQPNFRPIEIERRHTTPGQIGGRVWQPRPSSPKTYAEALRLAAEVAETHEAAITALVSATDRDYHPLMVGEKGNRPAS